jgi:ABC-type multidrug transport system fused ATPase/permease subunit
VVLQDVFLCRHGFNNITLNNQISREQVLAAAREIGVHDFIHDIARQLWFWRQRARWCCPLVSAN